MKRFIVTEVPHDPASDPWWEGEAENALDALDRFADTQGFARYSDIIASEIPEAEGLVGDEQSNGSRWAIFANTTVYAIPASAVEEGATR